MVARLPRGRSEGSQAHPLSWTRVQKLNERGAVLRGKKSWWITCAAALVLLATAPVAHASKLRLVAPRVSTFATDAERYLAWEVPSRQGITVLDTRTGHRHTLSAACRLMNGIPGPGPVGGAPAAAGRFLLECGEESRALLDARTGNTTLLPFLPPRPYAEYGPIWEGVGSRYVIGSAGTSG